MMSLTFRDENGHLKITTSNYLIILFKELSLLLFFYYFKGLINVTFSHLYSFLQRRILTKCSTRTFSSMYPRFQRIFTKHRKNLTQSVIFFWSVLAECSRKGENFVEMDSTPNNISTVGTVEMVRVKKHPGKRVSMLFAYFL